MLSSDGIREIVNRYIQMMCDTDIDGIIGLYAKDAVVEDPVGGTMRKGKEAIRAFYANATNALQVELKGPICIAGNHCAFLLLVRHEFENQVVYLDATDTFTFNDKGKIINMKAYLNLTETRDQP